MASVSPVVAAVAARDTQQLEAALSGTDVTVPARAVVDAGRLGWKAGLARLHRAGADLNGSYRHYRALHALIQEKPHAGGSSTPARVACLEWLLAHGADPEGLAGWPAARTLVTAAFQGERAYVDALRRGGAELNLWTGSALGDIRLVTRLLDSGPDLANARDGGLLTPLQCCAGSRLGRDDETTATRLLETARVLVGAGADVEACTTSYAHEVSVAYFAIRAGQVEMLKLLLDHGLDATPAVVAAAWEGRADILDLLIERGARLDAAFDRTQPVLNQLIRWGQFASARLLLERGASPNIPDAQGWTAMHRAASRGNAKMFQALIQAGGDVNRPDAVGLTPRAVARAKRLLKT
jgi:ankyrin repeat protein